MRNIKKRTEEKWTEHKGPVGHHHADQHTDSGSPRRRDSETGRIFKEIMDKISIFDKSLEYKYQNKTLIELQFYRWKELWVVMDAQDHKIHLII